jgi:V/A-type H+-transporting ATPase subunit I
MLLKMTHIQVIGVGARLDPTIAALHRLGVLHIVDAAKSSALGNHALDEASLRLQQELGFLAARLDALLRLLPPAPRATRDPTGEPERATTALADHARAELDRIAPEIQDLARARDELHAEALALPHYEVALRKLAPLAVELAPLQGFDTAALLIDRRYRDALGLLRLELARAAGSQFEMTARDVDEQTTAAVLVYPSQLAGAVQAALGQESITQVRLPKELAGRTFRDTLVALERRRLAIQAELGRLDARLEAAGAEWRGHLAGLRLAIKSRHDELSTRSRFGTTAYTFVIEGWVPTRELERVRAALAREVGPQVMVHELAPMRGDQRAAPVAFANPASLKPFEMLVRMLAIPHYGAFDPTPVMAVFLPLFFGVILGDVGYGALLLFLALYLRRRLAANETLRNLAQVLVYGSIWAIVFGFLYGELLGTLGPAVGLRPLWVAREGQHIFALFAFSIGLGVVQVVLGLLLGAWEAWRARQRSELLAKIGMLVVLSALFGIVGILAELLPRGLFTPAVVALLIGMALLIVPSGPLGLFLGPLEVLETIGNILSYLRLAAIGLSSVYLALVANQMAGLVGNLFVGAILALLLHALNFALGVMSPTIQSLRLHYVEFFRQFYHGGGEEYRPFRIE